MKQYDKAVPLLKQALNRNPNFLPAHSNLLVAYSELGREEEVHAEVAEVLRISPNFSVETLLQKAPIKDQAVVERWGTAFPRRRTS